MHMGRDAVSVLAVFNQALLIRNSTAHYQEMSLLMTALT
jgi:hypothetical protein